MWPIGLAGIASARLLAGLRKKIWKYVKDEQYLDIGDIGVNCNDWKKPQALDDSDMKIAILLCDASKAELDISSTDWKKATGAVNNILGQLMVEIRNEAKEYDGLVIDKYVKQGSSREGLKVFAADEFDVILQYHFYGLKYKVENLSSGGNILPQFAYLRVDSTMCELSWTHSRLHREGVFTERGGKPYINTRNLQENVFKTVIDKAALAVETKVNNGKCREYLEVKIKIRTSPPSVKIRIQLNDEDNGKHVAERLDNMEGTCNKMVLPAEVNRTKYMAVIDVDMVPGLLLSKDRVPDPTNKRRTMLCPTYAVHKWLTGNNTPASRYRTNSTLLWHICSSEYEKHVIDIAQGKPQQRHILNALRFLKLYFRKMQDRAVEFNEPQPQMVTGMQSYHLKNIALYCIHFLRVRNNVEISDVEVALAYMLTFLEVCLEERKLPHFFYANKNIIDMFPHFKCEDRALRYNLFQGRVVEESSSQDMQSITVMKDKMSKVIMLSSGTEVSKDIVNEFRNFVSSGQYYQ